MNKIDLRNCKPGDTLVCRDDSKVTYLGTNKQSERYPHLIEYDDGRPGSRTDDGYVLDSGSPANTDIVSIVPSVSAKQWVLDFLIPKLGAIPEEGRMDRINFHTGRNTWDEFITDLKENKDNLIEWVLTEFPARRGGIDFTDLLIQDLMQSCIMNINGKLIEVVYSTFTQDDVSEFHYVEERVTMVPVTEWVRI